MHIAEIICNQSTIILVIPYLCDVIISNNIIIGFKYIKGQDCHKTIRNIAIVCYEIINKFKYILVNKFNSICLTCFRRNYVIPKMKIHFFIVNGQMESLIFLTKLLLERLRGC